MISLRMSVPSRTKVIIQITDLIGNQVVCRHSSVYAVVVFQRKKSQTVTPH
jgi:hypothetical protein